MKTLREMINLMETDRQVDWIKEQLQNGALTKCIVENAQKDDAFNQYLKKVGQGVIDA